jgi:WD40 repeat protein
MKKSLAVLAVGVLAASAAWADELRVRITLKDNTVVEGSLDERRERTYRVHTPGGLREIAEDQVRRVDFLEAPAAVVTSAAPAKGPRLQVPEPWLEAGKLETKHFKLGAVLGGGARPCASPVTAISVSPDGTTVLTGGKRNELTLRDVITGRDQLVFHGSPLGSTENVAFLPGGKQFLADTRDAPTLDLWDMESRRVVRTFENLHRVTLRNWALSADGRRVITGDQEGPVKVWDVATGTLVRELLTPEEIGEGLALSPDGRLAAIADGPNRDKVSLQEVDTGHVRATVDSETFQKLAIRHVVKVAFTPDGQRVLAGGRGGLVLLDARDGSLVRELPKVTDVSSIAVSPDGKRALTGTWRGPFTLWDLEGGGELRTFEGLGQSVAFTPDGRHAVVAAESVVRLVDLATGESVPEVRGHTGPIEAISLTADGERALTSSFHSDETLKLWNVTTGVELWSSERQEDMIESVAISPDGRRAVAVLANGTQTWDLGARRLESTTREFGRGATIAFADDGKSWLRGGEPAWQSSPTNHAPIRREGEGEGAGVLVEHADGHVAFSRDQTAALSAWGNRVVLWDLVTGIRELSFTTSESSKWDVWSVAFSPGGSRALTGSQDGSVMLWELGKGERLARLEGHSGTVQAVAFLDKTRALSIGGGTLRLWDLSKLAELESLDLGAHGDPPRRLAVTRDGRKALVGTEAGAVLVFDVR